MSNLTGHVGTSIIFDTCMYLLGSSPDEKLISKIQKNWGLQKCAKTPYIEIFTVFLFKANAKANLRGRMAREKSNNLSVFPHSLNEVPSGQIIPRKARDEIST